MVFKTSAVVQPTARSVRLRRRSVVSSRPLPPEGEKLLAVDPSQFVAERDLLVRKLRSEDRQDEADAVAGLRKPSMVVFAVNRAACDRPKAARAAADAACKVRDAQVGNQPGAFKQGIEELDNALEMLAEVAVAHVAPRGKFRATPCDDACAICSEPLSQTRMRERRSLAARSPQSSR